MILYFRTIFLTVLGDAGTLIVDNEGFTPTWSPGALGSEDIAAVILLSSPTDAIPVTIIRGKAALRFIPEPNVNQLSKISGGITIVLC